ncbi:CCA tRNA nucleotidyltransferase [Sphingomonas psychrotolerans]|uniref:Polynucleotide adenylyltransferase n=1 Tax=Sphingomonas psychrotolerans TaxID=1327635 RepID=A0A2K8MCV5_9SPHN|nr:CCA tRNA nucleotidyltransferase [Sphingomonas psychrotolerans]ATY31730.1 polynucleotide adenylyltransferase [Sphingomonas psychrotolerans]
MDGLTLPAAEWRHREGLDRLVEVLGDARFVGGSVRDTLLGIPVSDVDLATALPPQRVVELLKEAQIRAVPTGLAHGTITAVLPSGPVEVTTLRRDVSTDGRRATVAFTDDWREDAARRDFTMNALYADPATGEIFDYFHGVADLEARHVRFIGDPLQRIAEDHLRILRFFRFLARFGDHADPEGLDACTARAKDLMALSRERIRDELLKLLVAKDAVGVVELMLGRGIFEPVLPEIRSAALLAHVAAREEAAGVAPNPIRRLAALLPQDPVAADQLGARLKLSNAERKRLVTAVSPPDGAPKPLAYRLGVESAVDILILSDGEVAQIFEVKSWQPPRLPLTGGALVELGLAKGPDVARALRAVEDRWISEGFPAAERVAALADEAVAQALRAARKA